MNKLIWLVYDGIAHSVFAGQVITPAVKLCDQNPEITITIITFEKRKPPQTLIDKYCSIHPRLRIRVMRKLPFLGTVSLYVALYQLKKYLSFDKLRMSGEEGYELKARGPLAGWLALHASDARNNPSSLSASSDYVTVQARGLLAEEYWYRYGKEKNLLKRIFHIWRHRELEAIEREVYGSKRIPPVSFDKLRTSGREKFPLALSLSKGAKEIKDGYKIEAVTPAMKEYLIKTYNADAQTIYIAQIDIPPVFEPAQITQWKHTIRNELNIARNAHVYCFIGSVKAWQKPDMVVEYFLKKLDEDPNAILLLLTKDIALFTRKLIDYKVPLTHVRILSVTHEEIYTYLSAANTGLIFRDNHILSRVARPVKAMEYQSVGLEIVHNGTVDWLNQMNF